MSLSLWSKDIHLLLKKRNILFHSLIGGKSISEISSNVCSVTKYFQNYFEKWYFSLNITEIEKSIYLDIWLNPRHDTYRHEVLTRNKLSLSTTEKNRISEVNDFYDNDSEKTLQIIICIVTLTVKKKNVLR